MDTDERNEGILELNSDGAKEKILKKLKRFNLFKYGFFSIIIGGIIIVAIVFNLGFVYVRPNQYGVKLVRIGVHRGVQKKIYNTGLHIIIPAMQEMYFLPKDYQVLELTKMKDTAAQFSRIVGAAHIQTSDGFFVNVHVSIIYKIVDPHLVFTTIGPGNLFEDNGIIPKAEPVLKATFGELTTEEFYNSPLRVKKADAAKKMLNRELKDKGIHVEHVLVRYFQYSTEIQRNIEEKKLKDQLVFKNQAEARAATEGAILKKIVQEGKAIVDVELEKGKSYATRKMGEMELYVRKKRASADLLVKLAEAEKIRLKNEALKGVGGERMVGLKMAEVYKGMDMIILPSDGPNGVNPLDLDRAMKLFDLKKEN